MEFSKNLSTALSKMMVQQPFFSSLLYMQCELREAKSHPQWGPVNTGATDGKTIVINPDFAAKLSVNQVVHLLAHEITHVMFLHCPRKMRYATRGAGPDGKPFNNDRWAAAVDYVTNHTIVAAGVGEKIAGGYYMDGLTGNETVEDVYNKLPEDFQGGGGSGSGFDDHVAPADRQEPSEADLANMEASIAAAVATAKSMGKMPESLLRMIGEMFDHKLPWQEILRREAAKNMRNHEVGWSRPNRRKLGAGNPILYPSQNGERAGDLVIQLDCSGSISMAELDTYLSETIGIFEDFPPAMAHLLLTTDSVCKTFSVEDLDELYEVIDDMKRNGVPTGGTDMTEGFAWCAEHGIVPTQFICFTDGLTPFGEEPPYPVIWCMTTGERAPYGLNIDVEVGE